MLLTQLQSTHKLGLALSLENVSEEVQEVAERAEKAGAIPSPPY